MSNAENENQNLPPSHTHAFCALINYLISSVRKRMGTSSAGGMGDTLTSKNISGFQNCILHPARAFLWHSLGCCWTTKRHTDITFVFAQAGLVQRMAGIYPQSQTVPPALLNIKAQMDVLSGGGEGTTKGWEGSRKGHLGRENHRAHLHKKGSILISREEQGMVSSNLVITSGWRTPSFPTLWPLAKTSAHRPGKKAGPGPTPSVFTDLQFLQCCARLEFTKLLTHLPHQQADKDQAHSSWPVQPEQLLAWAINTQQSCATSLQLAPSEWVHYLWKNKLLTANGSKVSIMKKYRMGESRGARDCPVSTSCGTNAQDAAHFVISTEGYLFIFLENF